MLAEALTIPALIRNRVRRDAQRQAVVTENDSLDYAGLDRESRKIAWTLVSEGVVKGARVALIMGNGIDWACVAIAVLRIGAVLVPISTFLRAPELKQHLRVAAVTYLITVDSFGNRDFLLAVHEILPSFEPLSIECLRNSSLPSLRKIWRWEDLKSRALQAAAGDCMVEALGDRVTAADDMCIVFTSGSRGMPKGVIHTHGNALRAVAASLQVRCLQPDDRLYIPMPFFWTGGFSQGLLSILSIGATLLIDAVPEPRRTLRFLERERVTLFRGWPDQALQFANHPDFLKADLSSLRLGSLDVVMPREKRAKSPAARAKLFGMTETFGPYCGERLDADMPERKWGSCGRALEGIEVRIVNLHSGAPAAAGETGLIKVRGRNLMRGICGLRRHEVFDLDGFYPTGDLGYLDDDKYLFFVGRSDDAFKVKGATVYPSEVEEALQTITGIQRAFVVDIAVGGNDERGVGVVVLLKEGSELSEGDLAEAARQRLSTFKIPSRWLIVKAISDVPLLESGKINKPALQGIFSRANMSRARESP